MSYVLQLAETNEYMGYRLFDIDFQYLALVLGSIITLGLLMPTKIRKPSDFFFFLYVLFVLLPYITLFPIRNSVEPLEFISYFASLLFPLLCIRLITSVVSPLRVSGLITQDILLWLVIGSCVGVVSFSLLHSPGSASFTLTNSYERRIEGRDVFQAGTPIAYLNSTVVNGFAPFLAFIAAWSRKNWLMGLSVTCGISYFYMLGLKAPIFFIFLAFIVGRAAYFDRVNAIIKMIYLLLFGVFLVFLIEYSLFGFSVVGDYFIRRAFTIPPYVMSAYFDFMSSSPASSWSIQRGASPIEPIMYIIGEDFLGGSGSNANTNAFLNQLAAGGLITYLFTVLLVSILFSILDAAFLRKFSAIFLYLGFSYAILLTEQAATTALVSSGLGLLIILNIITISNKGKNTNFRDINVG